MFSGKLITYNRHNQVDDHLDVVAENLAMPLDSPLAQSLAALAASGHLGEVVNVVCSVV